MARRRSPVQSRYGPPGSRNSTHFAKQNTRSKITTENFYPSSRNCTFLVNGVFLKEKLCRIFTTWSTRRNNPNWQGSCLENRCLQGLAGSSPASSAERVVFHNGFARLSNRAPGRMTGRVPPSPPGSRSSASRHRRQKLICVKQKSSRTFTTWLRPLYHLILKKRYV